MKKAPKIRKLDVVKDEEEYSVDQTRAVGIRKPILMAINGACAGLGKSNSCLY